MKERYGEPFGLNEKEVKDLYDILDVAECFLSKYADFLEEGENRDDGSIKRVLVLRIAILSFQRRIIDWLELNIKPDKTEENE